MIFTDDLDDVCFIGNERKPFSEMNPLRSHC